MSVAGLCLTSLCFDVRFNHASPILKAPQLIQKSGAGVLEVGLINVIIPKASQPYALSMLFSCL